MTTQLSPRFGLVVAALFVAVAPVALATPIQPDWQAGAIVGPHTTYGVAETGAAPLWDAAPNLFATPVDWAIQFDATARELTFAFGQQAPLTLAFSQPLGALESLSITAFVDFPGNPARWRDVEAVALWDLNLTGVNLDLPQLPLVGLPGITSQLVLRDLDLRGDWTLSGQAIFAWLPWLNSPQHEMGFMIEGQHATSATHAPEPLSVVLVSLGLGALAMRRRNA